jgi:hypothetical protein
MATTAKIRDLNASMMLDLRKCAQSQIKIYICGWQQHHHHQQQHQQHQQQQQQEAAARSSSKQQQQQAAAASSSSKQQQQAAAAAAAAAGLKRSHKMPTLMSHGTHTSSVTVT